MLIYAATWLQEDSQKESLDNVDKRERLLSFYLIKESKKSLRDYITGRKRNEDT